MLPSSVTGYVRLCKGNRSRINADMQSCGKPFSTTRAGTIFTGYLVISWVSIRKYQPAHRPYRKQIFTGSILFLTRGRHHNVRHCQGTRTNNWKSRLNRIVVESRCTHFLQIFGRT